MVVLHTRTSGIQILGGLLFGGPAVILTAIAIMDPAASLGGKVAGCVFVLFCGLLIVSARAVTWADAERRELVGGIFFKKRTPIEKTAKLRLITNTQSSGEDGVSVTATWSTVRIEQGDDSHLIVLTQNAMEARAVAELTARTLKLPIRIEHEGEQSLVHVEHLDEPLRDRIAREGTPAPAPEPASPTATLERGDDGLTIEIPGRTPNMTGPLLAAVVVGGAFAAYKAEIVNGFVLFLAILITLANVVGALVWRRDRASHHRTTLRVDASTFTVIRHTMLGKSTTAFPLDELEDLTVRSVGTDGLALFARSDKRQLAFGGGIAEDELHYLRNAVARAIAGE